MNNALIKPFFFFFSFTFIAAVAFGLEVIISSGSIEMPNRDGVKSGEGVGDAATVFMCIADAATYQAYANDSSGLYNAWKNGDFNLSQYHYLGNADKVSSQRDYTIEDYPIDVFDGVTLYAIAVAEIYIPDFHRTYYIARTINKYVDDDFTPCYFGKAISGAESWSYIDDEPPSITCTDLCVTGGVVSATYSISEFLRLNEIVSNEETSVIVAADLARTTQTNLAASVTATNSGESTFTFSFNPAEQNWTNSTLFIFGVEPPR
ncbi:MAG: hypothetical protein IKO40_01975 [Kiritimatiellae bacterium]|nr:hypothetical protein [Kiritimatiellia bacterium]